jgi:hypothetical protein
LFYRPRQNFNFVSRLNAILVVQPRVQKYFAFPEIRIGGIVCHPAPLEGRLRNRQETRCGMRWTPWRARRSATEADGKVVWSWPPDAGVKLAVMIR